MKNYNSPEILTHDHRIFVLTALSFAVISFMSLSANASNSDDFEYEPMNVAQLEADLNQLDLLKEDMEFETLARLSGSNSSIEVSIEEASENKKMPENTNIIPMVSTDVDGNTNDELTSTYVVNINSDIEQGIEPKEYLPEYEHIDNSDDTDKLTELKPKTPFTASKVNVFKKVYANVFNDGQVAIPKIHADFYQKTESGSLIKLSDKKQPYKNISAALSEYPIESLINFTSVSPIILESAIAAAEAVGYYDVDMIFVSDNGDFNVIIESLGDPVIVDNSIIDIRGDGSDFNKFDEVVKETKPKVGDTLNHNEYEVSKSSINNTSKQYGYFDGKWLNSSVDVILPDNIADINMVYDTGSRYDFDDVVFYTLDANTQQMTTDPDKLPLKPELLDKLLDFKKNDGFDAKKIQSLRNDLSATQYFNRINVDVILPENKLNSKRVESQKSSGTKKAFAKSNVSYTNSINSSANIQSQSMSIIAPIAFGIDEQTDEKYLAVFSKANQMYDLPDNQILAINRQKSTNLLGQISDAISDVVTNILPDEDSTDPLSDQVNKKTIELSSKKSVEQVRESKKIPVYVMVVANKPQDAEIGLGWGTDTGVRLRTQYDHNLINRSGYKGGVSASWSDIQKNTQVYIQRPLSHPLDDVLNGSLGYEEEVVNQGTGNFDLKTRSFLTGISRNIISDDSWNKSYSLRYRRDDLESGVDSSEYSNLPVRFATGKATQEALLLGYGVNKTVVDNLNNPKFGWRQQYSLSLGAKSVATDTNIAIARAAISGIYSFGQGKKHQVQGKIDTGYLWSSNLDDVPYQLRFFAGGDQSIRGYDYKSLSPINNGYLTGGDILAVGSAEYNYEIIPNLRMAIFTDVGNAYDKEFTTNTKVGLGAGIRWMSPIGLVRLDIAAGIKEEDKPIRLHLYIGSPL